MNKIFAYFILFCLVFGTGCGTFVYDKSIPPEKLCTLRVEYTLKVKQIDDKKVSATSLSKVRGWLPTGNSKLSKSPDNKIPYYTLRDFRYSYGDEGGKEGLFHRYDFADSFFVLEIPEGDHKIVADYKDSTSTTSGRFTSVYTYSKNDVSVSYNFKAGNIYWVEFHNGEMVVEKHGK